MPNWRTITDPDGSKRSVNSFEESEFVPFSDLRPEPPHMSFGPDAHPYAETPQKTLSRRCEDQVFRGIGRVDKWTGRTEAMTIESELKPAALRPKRSRD